MESSFVMNSSFECKSRSSGSRVLFGSGGLSGIRIWSRVLSGSGILWN